jgi:hypothetical protein
VIKTIDTFYALDFDRCLGNYEANVSLIKEVIDELSTINGQTFQSAHDETKATGISFRVLDYLKDNDPDTNIDNIQNVYTERAHAAPGSLLESGADDFINFLRAANHSFCIMSFGDKNWQTTKITAAGFGEIAKLIVSNEYKGQQIAEWFDEQSGHFIIPKECFVDRVTRRAREVVLVDDKVKAFDGLHSNARGYLLQDISRIYASQQGKIPSSVRRVTRLDEIIEHEKFRVTPDSKRIDKNTTQ